MSRAVIAAVAHSPLLSLSLSLLCLFPTPALLNSLCCHTFSHPFRLLFSFPHRSLHASDDECCCRSSPIFDFIVLNSLLLCCSPSRSAALSSLTFTHLSLRQWLHISALHVDGSCHICRRPIDGWSDYTTACQQLKQEQRERERERVRERRTDERCTSTLHAHCRQRCQLAQLTSRQI